MKLQDPSMHPALIEARETITYDFICEGGAVLPHLQRIFEAGHGKSVKFSPMPSELTARINKALHNRMSDSAVISQVPRFFPGVKVAKINDTPDYISECKPLMPQLKKLFKVGQDLSNKNELSAFYTHDTDAGWLIFYADKATDLEKMTQFIEVNAPRWDTFSRRDQLPGEECAKNRKHPLSVIPGSEEAKTPIDEGEPQPERQVEWIGVGDSSIGVPVMEIIKYDSSGKEHRSTLAQIVKNKLSID